MDAAQGYPYYGGTVAAPGSGDIKGFIAVSECSFTRETNLTGTEESSLDTVLVPDLVNLPLSDALSSLNNRGLNAKIDSAAAADHPSRLMVAACPA